MLVPCGLYVIIWPSRDTLHIPVYRPTHSNHMRPPVPDYAPSVDEMIKHRGKPNTTIFDNGTKLTSLAVLKKC